MFEMGMFIRRVAEAIDDFRRSCDIPSAFFDDCVLGCGQTKGFERV